MAKFAFVQMASSGNLEANLKKMRAFTEEAKSQGAEAVLFPELAYFSGTVAENAAVVSQYNECRDTFAKWAKELQIGLLPGSLREPKPGEAAKHYNTLPAFGRTGKLLAEYRKIFLFRAKLPDRNYDEGETFLSGSTLETIDFGFGKVGLSICFDLRFPELFRALKKKGCSLVLVPAAFTVPTGQAHWRPLLQSRAIENQVFVIAAGQVGKNGDGAVKYGHSMAFSPWGDVLSEMDGTSEGVSTVELNFDQIRECEGKVHSWACRREELFPIAGD